MRADTEAAIAQLPQRGRKRIDEYTAAFEELESRLAPGREVRAAFVTVARPKGGDTYNADPGALMISSYGFHWLGERSGRLDMSWEQVIRHDVIAVPLSMIRKSKRAFYLEVETQDHDLRFHLLDEQMAEFVKGVLTVSQPLL